MNIATSMYWKGHLTSSLVGQNNFHVLLEVVNPVTDKLHRMRRATKQWQHMVNRNMPSHTWSQYSSLWQSRILQIRIR